MNRDQGTARPQATVALPAEHPCAQCPWRTVNQGKRHPEGWYTKANIRRLWAGMRRGEHMTCHPTDSEMDWPEGWPAPAPGHTRECSGGIVMQHREFEIIQQLILREDDAGRALAIYRRHRPRGLTREGMAAVIERAMFGRNIFAGDEKDPPLDMNDPVGIPELPWPFDLDELV